MTDEGMPSRVPQGSVRWRGRIDLAMVIATGIGAGVIATVAQLALWWLTDTPVAETFFRDARLTAALVMGNSVLPPPATPHWNILLIATLIHFALSIAYALLPAHLASRLKTGPALLAGVLYGLAIYLVNLYGFAVLFPWFVVTRNWITLVTHLVFGIALVGGSRLYAGSLHGDATRIPVAKIP